MSISSIGSTPSLWQQDQNYWNDQSSWDNTSAASDSLINAIGTAETNLGKGLAAIANQTALSRVNSQLSAAIQSVLSPSTTSTSSTSSTTSSASSPSSSASQSTPVAASGTGTDPLTVGTTLSTLGIPAGGTITITAGANTTTYASTGSDTVGELMSAINADYVGNAAVTASLSKTGQLVLTSKNTSDTIVVGGTYASNIGFAAGHQTFAPTTAPSSSSTASATAASAAASTTSTASSATSSSSTAAVQSLASITASSAASLLSDSGVSGSLVDMLA